MKRFIIMLVVTTALMFLCQIDEMAGQELPLPNQPPVANAGENKVVYENDRAGYVALNGTASYDPDGDPITYFWEQIEEYPMHNTATVTILNRESAIAQFAIPEVGGGDPKDPDGRGIIFLTFQLTVTDDKGLSSSDIVKVDVLNSPYQQYYTEELNDSIWQTAHDYLGRNYEFLKEIDTKSVKEGEYCLCLWLNGFNDDGTMWIEKQLLLGPGEYKIDLSFYLLQQKSEADPFGYAVAYIGEKKPQLEVDFERIDRLDQEDGWTPFAYSKMIINTQQTQIWIAAGISCTWEGKKTYWLDCIEAQGIPINQPPILDPIGDKVINEDELLEFTISASDPDGDALTYLAKNLPRGASFGPSDCKFSWRPDYNQSGRYSGIHFEVSDGKGGIDFEDITITVNNVNQPPVLYPIGNKTVTAGSTLRFLVTATDPDIDPLKITTSQLPDGAIFRLYNGPHIPENMVYEFIWIPRRQQIGEYKVTFTVTDEKLTDSETIIIYVIKPGSDKRITGKNRR